MKEQEEYQQSAEYLKLKQELSKKDEEDEGRNDTDPKGYDLYCKILEDPLAKAL